MEFVCSRVSVCLWRHDIAWTVAWAFHALHVFNTLLRVPDRICCCTALAIIASHSEDAVSYNHLMKLYANSRRHWSSTSAVCHSAKLIVPRYRLNGFGRRRFAVAARQLGIRCPTAFVTQSWVSTLSSVNWRHNIFAGYWRQNVLSALEIFLEYALYKFALYLITDSHSCRMMPGERSQQYKELKKREETIDGMFVMHCVNCAFFCECSGIFASCNYC